MDLHTLLCKSTAYRAMNIIDAVLCADVIEDAKLEGGLTKIRAKLNKVYGKIDSSIQTQFRSADNVYEGLENSDQYDEAFYERLEQGQFDELGVPLAEVGTDEGGLPGIPMFG